MNFHLGEEDDDYIKLIPHGYWLEVEVFDQSCFANATLVLDAPDVRLLIEGLTAALAEMKE